MKPMPMPGPIAESPYPIRLTLPVTAATMMARRCMLRSPFWSVLVAHGQRDVHGGQDREHVRLDGGDEDLQADHQDRQRQRAQRERDRQRPAPPVPRPQ